MFDPKNRTIVYDGVLTTIHGGAQTVSVRGDEMTLHQAALEVIETLIGPGEPIAAYLEENRPENDITGRIAEPNEDWTYISLYDTHSGYAALLLKRNIGEEAVIHNQPIVTGEDIQVAVAHASTKLA